MDDSPSSVRTRLPLFALLAANAVSLLGNVVAAIAIPWLVLEETGSAALTGLAASLAALPLAAGAFFGGAIVDRIGARRATVIADLASGASVAAIPLLDAAGRLSFAAIAAAAFLGALFDAPGQAARQALVPELAERGLVPLERVNSLLVGTEHIGYVLGAPAAGGLVVLLGPAEALWVDAASFAACALLVALAVPGARPAIEPGRRYLRDLVDGLRFVRRDAVVLALIANATLGNLLIRAINPLMSTVRQERAPPELLGRVVATNAAAVAVSVPIGTLLGGLAIEWLGLRGAIAVFAGANVVLSLAVVAVLVRGRLSLAPAAAEP